MPIYTVKLVNRNTVATDTLQFDFEKPDGFNYLAGQYGGFNLINPSETDEKGTNRRFTLCSAPNEDLLSVVTRVQTSAFKKVLSTMPIGDEIKLVGPSGKFVLNEDNNQPVVFIAGGIGIAPFYSMLKDLVAQKSPRQVTLLYGNESLETAAYLNELNALSEQIPLTVINTLSNPPSTWAEEKGYITHTMIKKYVSDITKPMFYVCGTPAMVTTMHETLQEMDIPEEHIQVEDFPGY